MNFLMLWLLATPLFRARALVFAIAVAGGVVVGGDAVFVVIVVTTWVVVIVVFRQAMIRLAFHLHTTLCVCRFACRWRTHLMWIWHDL